MRLGMKGVWAIPVMFSILFIGSLGLTPNAYAATGTITFINPADKLGKITEDDCNDSTCEHPFQIPGDLADADYEPAVGDRVTYDIGPGNTASNVAKLNHPPTIGSVIFTAEFPTPETVFLTCTANDVSDADGDDVTLSFKWIRFFDGIVLGTESTLTVPHTSVRYTCEVTPFDGIDFGEPVSFTFTPCPLCGGI